MHIDDENTVNSYAWVHLVFFFILLVKKTVNGYA